MTLFVILATTPSMGILQKSLAFILMTMSSRKANFVLFVHHLFLRRFLNHAPLLLLVAWLLTPGNLSYNNVILATS